MQIRDGSEPTTQLGNILVQVILWKLLKRAFFPHNGVEGYVENCFWYVHIYGMDVDIVDGNILQAHTH